ncbi:MAG: VTT domain-containing protein [Pararhizobium sp.]
MTLNFLLSHKICMILALFLATFVHEDFAIIGGSYLVSRDHVSLAVVLMATLFGVLVGDLAIYGLGALCARWRWLRTRLERRGAGTMPQWIDRNLAVAVIGCRFIPVTLFPTFVACGFTGVPFRRFAAFAALSAFVYVPALFAVTLLVGEEATETVGSWAWLVVVSGGLAFVILRKKLPVLIGRERRARDGVPMHLHQGMPPLTRRKVRVAWQERVSEKIYYIPVVIHWLAMAVRFRSLTLPTIANPLIEAGGLLGESKIACMGMVPGRERPWLARTTAIATQDGDAVVLVKRALQAAALAGISFPLIVKPDVGWRGFGVRRVDSEAELAAYLAAFPAGVEVVLQEYIPFHGEAGVFYVRRPGERRGEIFSLTLRYFPFVVGDGRASLADLIARDPRTRWKAEQHLACNAARLATVPAAGEVVRLAVVGSNRVGGLYVDARGFVTEAMRARFDAISQSIPEFYFGRYDIRFNSIEDLRAGRGFSIVEINGAGAEAIHIWDPDCPILTGYATLLRQQRLLFEIAAANRARGFKPLGIRKLIGYQRLQARVLKSVPHSA